MKPNLLIISQQQFYHLTDTYKYCEHSKSLLNISYLCWDYNHFKTSLEGVNVIYVSRSGGKMYRIVRLFYAIYKELKSKKYDVVFIVYFKGVSLIKLFRSGLNVILDVRTLKISKSFFCRASSDYLLRFESIFFKNKTVIDSAIGFKLQWKEFTVIPLGGDLKSPVSRCIINGIRLIYVGTLENREILKCLKAFHQIVIKNEFSDVCFAIIGDGPKDELEQLRKYVQNNSLNEFVVLYGKIPHEKVVKEICNSDIGISYIPINEYFDLQPPTKTFEYLLSGIPVLATNTNANSKIVNDGNGILVEDDVDSFSIGMGNIIHRVNKGFYNTNKIQNSVSANNWQNIVRTIFIPLIMGLTKDKMDT